ncbi:MAG: hypothetical protein NVS1B2_15830 [Vulcanimicrobiaceae bacterium]
MPALDIADIDTASLREKSQSFIEAEKQCRMTLAADAKRPVELNWHGGRGHRPSVIMLEPSRSVVQPLSKAMAWFGPFGVIREYLNTSDEKRKEHLRQFYAEEKSRALNRYDYVRPISMSKDGGFEPIGAHRFPDVTVQVLEADGTEQPPIRLHELYKIGDFDPIKDTFGVRESVDAVRTRYEGELEEQRGRYEREMIELRRQMAEVAGMVKGALSRGPNLKGTA